LRINQRKIGGGTFPTLSVETSLDYLFKEVVLPAQESPVLAFLAIYVAVFTCIVSFLSEYGDKYQHGLYAISGLILVKSIADIWLKPIHLSWVLP